MSFTIQRILGIAPLMVLGLLLTAAPGLAQVPGPDLVVNLLSPAPPATALPGDAFVIAATVKNQGTAAAGVSITKFNLVKTPGGTIKNLKGVQNISALAIGASAAPAVTLEIYSDTVPGDYFVQACANSVTPKIPETNTTNNCFQTTAKITVRNGPDLAVTAITSPPSVVSQGQSFAATYTVTNTGGEPAGASLVKFYMVPTVGTIKFGMKTVPAEAVGLLGPGATFTHTLPLTVRPETAPGTYRVQGCADSGKVVIESDEDDNCKTSVGTVQVTPAADLLVQKVTVLDDPMTVAQNGVLSTAVTVRNNGLLDAPASTMKLRLVSTGATPLQTGLKGDVAVPPIPTGAKVIVHPASVVDDETEPGTYFVQACTDYSNVVAESSEKNNCTTGTEMVTVTGLSLSPADLAVTALTSPPPTRLPGETFALTATVKNNGTGASPATTSKFYLVNALVNPTLRKNLKGVQPLGPLAAGATNATPVTVEVYADTVPGNYFLQACADGEKLLREVNENDNCLTATAAITVSQVPNLVVTQVGNPPATAVPGKTSFTMTETVQNVGPVGALASQVGFTLVSTVDPLIRFDLKGIQDVPPLGAAAIFNGSGTVTVSSQTLPGSYRVQACADDKKVVFESDEDANCAMSTGAIQVAAVPDLIVFSVQPPVPQATVARGGTVVLNTVVKNQGLGDAADSFVRFFLVLMAGAAPIKNIPEAVPVGALVHGASRSINATVTVPTGTPVGIYLIQACVDKANLVAESSDENNCGTSVGTLKVQ